MISSLSIPLLIPNLSILGDTYIGTKEFNSIALYTDLWQFLAISILSCGFITALIPANIPHVLPFTNI